MIPLTRTIPKPLLPLLNQPILDWITSSLSEAGIREVGVVVSPGFPSDLLETLNCECFIQKKTNGMGAAILEAEDWLDTDSFVVCAGDSFFPSTFVRELLDLHNNQCPSVTIATEKATWAEMTTRSCVILDQHGNVSRIIEKPTLEQATGNLAAAPIYVFRQNIISELKKAKPSPRGEIEVQTGIQSIIDKGKKVTYTESPRWIHLTSLRDLFDANMRLLDQKASNIEKSITRTANIFSPVAIAPSAEIANDSVIGPRAVIGQRVTVISMIELRDVLVLPNTIVQASYTNGILWPEGFISMQTDSRETKQI